MKAFLDKKIVFIAFIVTILFSLQKTYAQDDNFWSNVRLGGNIGIGFTGDTFNGVLAPSAVYEFNTQFSAGFGVSIGYTNSSDFSATNYGASIITLYNPLPGLQLSAEFEQTRVNNRFKIEGPDIRENYWYPALFLGAGYRIGFVSAGVRYDVLYDEDDSIYGSAIIPFVRVFF